MSITNSLSLIDHHCHGLLPYDIADNDFRLVATESDWLAPEGTETLDSPFGLAIRKFCGPLLGLERHVSIPEYLQRRRELGYQKVHEALMGSTGTGHFLIESGFRASPVMSPTQMKAATETPASEIVRLETLAETVAANSSVETFTEDFRAALQETAEHSVGFKTIIAYRYGFDVEPSPPSPTQVQSALDEWFSTAAQSNEWRLEHPVILQHLLWEAVPFKKPIQMHTGYGDSDVSLFRADPSRLTGFLAATRTSGATFTLLHCYPFVREAAILAQVFPHVYFDVGLVSHYTGPSVSTSLREALEITPFSKLLYSSDAHGLAEHYAVSAQLWRRGINQIFDEWIADDWLTASEAERFARMIAGENAARLYNLPREV